MDQSVQAEAVLECDCLVIVIVIVSRGGFGRSGFGRGGFGRRCRCRHLTAAVECKQVVGTHFFLEWVLFIVIKKTG
jgi:hypothetical protein